MKIEVKDIVLTHEDLVTLFSCAVESNPVFFVDVSISDYLPYVDKSDDYYDMLVKVLSSGQTIYVSDRFAEDKSEFYGELKHVWKIVDHCMRYEVDMKAVIRGIEKAMNTNRGMSVFSNLIFDERVHFDAEDGDYLLQYIVFGDYIYG